MMLGLSKYDIQVEYVGSKSDAKKIPDLDIDIVQILKV